MLEEKIFNNFDTWSSWVWRPSRVYGYGGGPKNKTIEDSILSLSTLVLTLTYILNFRILLSQTGSPSNFVFDKLNVAKSEFVEPFSLIFAFL